MALLHVHKIPYHDNRAIWHFLGALPSPIRSCQMCIECSQIRQIFHSVFSWQLAHKEQFNDWHRVLLSKYVFYPCIQFIRNVDIRWYSLLQLGWDEPTVWASLINAAILSSKLGSMKGISWNKATVIHGYGTVETSQQRASRVSIGSVSSYLSIRDYF